MNSLVLTSNSNNTNLLETMNYTTLVETNPGLAIPYVTILTIGCVTGTLGNILVIVSILTTKKLRTIGNTLIVNLAVADLFVCSVMDPSAVIGAFLGAEFYLRHPMLCEISGGFVVVSCLASVASVLLISLHRFCHICFYSYCSKIFTTRSSGVMVAAVWTLAILTDLRYMMKWGTIGHIYDHKMEQCFYDRKAKSMVLKILAFITFLSVTVSYSGIFYFVRNQRKSLNDRRLNRERENSIKLAQTLLVIVVTLYLCIMPYTVATVLEKSTSLGRVVYIPCIMMAYLNSSINWLIYGLTNQQFRKAFKHTLCLK